MRFEAAVRQLTTEFVERIAELARQGARGMAERALEASATAPHAGGRSAGQRKAGTSEAERQLALFLARIARGERPAYTRARDEFERLYIASVLADHDGNVTHAAAALRLTRQSLQRMIQRLGVRRIVRD